MKTSANLLAALLFLLPLTARADVTLIQVTGVFDATQSIDETGLNTFAPLQSQPFTFVFAYDPSVPDSADGIDNFGTYVHGVPPHQATLTSGGVTGTAGASGYEIRVIGPPNSPSNYGLGTLNPADFTGLTLPGGLNRLGFSYDQNISDAAVGFLDNGGAGDDPLPNTPFFIGEPLNGAKLRVYLTVGNDTDGYFDEFLIGNITSITAVPEPSSLALLATAGLLCTRRRRASPRGPLGNTQGKGML